MEENDLQKEELEVEENTKIKDSDQKKESIFSRIKHKRESIKEATLKQVDEESKKDDEENQREIEKKLEEENDENAPETEEKKSSPIKKKLFNIFFLIFNIGIVVGLLLWNIMGSGEFTPLRFVNINVWALLLYVFLIIFATSIDTLSVHTLIYRKTYRSNIAISYKAMAIGRHYDNVIPFASGGQSFMASYLRRRNVPGAISFYIPMAKLIAMEMGWLFVALFCLIFSSRAGDLSYVKYLSIIGFILSIFGLGIIIFVSVFKRFTKKVIPWGCKILHKLHIVKNYDEKVAQATKAVEDYQTLMQDFSRHKVSFIFQFLLHILRYIVYYSVPFVIYCIFNGFPKDGGTTFTTLFISASLIELAACFIPVPGGSGMNEISFAFLFGKFFGGETFWALLLWRFFNYYGILLQGIGVLTYETVIGDRKYLWTKKKQELQTESAEFKKLTIDAFRSERNKKRKREKLARAK